MEQFEILRKLANINRFIHYEISNLCLPGFESRHNTSYWKGVPYLGLGPSAHSYSKVRRSWNPNSISAWAESIEKGILPSEEEVLSEKDKLNEYLMVSLRTIWGISINEIEEKFGAEKAKVVAEKVKKHLLSGSMRNNGDRIQISPSHFFISDSIVLDLIF